MTCEEFISATNHPGDLAQVFHATYERSGDTATMIEKRVQAANDWYDYLFGLIGGLA
jgi:hypothetical protein